MKRSTVYGSLDLQEGPTTPDPHTEIRVSRKRQIGAVVVCFAGLVLVANSTPRSPSTATTTTDAVETRTKEFEANVDIASVKDVSQRLPRPFPFHTPSQTPPTPPPPPHPPLPFPSPLPPPLPPPFPPPPRA